MSKKKASNTEPAPEAEPGPTAEASESEQGPNPEAGKKVKAGPRIGQTVVVMQGGKPHAAIVVAISDRGALNVQMFRDDGHAIEHVCGLSGDKGSDPHWRWP